MKTKIYNTVKILIVVFVVAVFIAAGAEEESQGIINTANGPLMQEYEIFVVSAGIMSVWLTVLGMMCHQLENIPDLSSKRKKFRHPE